MVLTDRPVRLTSQVDPAAFERLGSNEFLLFISVSPCVADFQNPVTLLVMELPAINYQALCPKTWATNVKHSLLPPL